MFMSWSVQVAEKCVQNWREEPVFCKPVGYVPGGRKVSTQDDAFHRLSVQPSWQTPVKPFPDDTHQYGHDCLSVVSDPCPLPDRRLPHNRCRP